MSDDDKTDAVPEERPAPGGDATMQVDAFSEMIEAAEGAALPQGAVEAQVLDEVAVGVEAPGGGAASVGDEHGVTVPPPLPAKRPGRTVIIVGVVVVLVAAGLGIAFGQLLIGGDEQPTAGEAAEGSEAAGAQTEVEGAGEEPTPIRLDTVVIGTEPVGADDEEAPEAPVE